MTLFRLFCVRIVNTNTNTELVHVLITRLTDQYRQTIGSALTRKGGVAVLINFLIGFLVGWVIMAIVRKIRGDPDE